MDQDAPRRKQACLATPAHWHALATACPAMHPARSADCSSNGEPSSRPPPHPPAYPPLGGSSQPAPGCRPWQWQWACLLGRRGDGGSVSGLERLNRSPSMRADAPRAVGAAWGRLPQALHRAPARHCSEQRARRVPGCATWCSHMGARTLGLSGMRDGHDAGDHSGVLRNGATEGREGQAWQQWPAPCGMHPAASVACRFHCRVDQQASTARRKGRQPRTCSTDPSCAPSAVLRLGMPQGKQTAPNAIPPNFLQYFNRA